MKLRSLLAGCALACGTLFGIGSATAGHKYPATLTVTIGTGWAIGALGATHNSANTVEELQISTAVWVGGSSVSVFARDSTGRYASCYSSRPEFIDAVRAINPDTYLQFNWNTATGECTNLYIYSASGTLPKAP